MPPSAGQTNPAVLGGRLPRLPSRARRFAPPPTGGLTPARAALVLALVAAWLGVRLLIQPVTEGHAVYPTVYPVVLLCAVLWGKGPGLLAAVVGTLGADLLTSPPRLLHLELTPASAFSFAALVGSAFLVGVVADRWRASEAATRASAAERRRTEEALRRREANLKEIAESLRRSDVRLLESVSERKQAEQALRAANASLVEVDQRRAAFLAVLSHELRNPLAPIRSGLHILDRAPAGGPQARRAYEVIGRQVTHLTRLIDDLLDVTRLSRGKIRLRRERVELCALIHRTAEDHRATFAAGGVELEIDACDGPLHVDGDPTRLAQVIGNLLTNAAKFTSAGGRVTLAFRADRDTATIRVRDDGAGIPAVLLGSLFEPFVQADATLDRSKGGLGLGLALAKGLVELHGGRVEAWSAGPGTGAEFTVWLPLVAGEPAQPVAGPAAGVNRPLVPATRTLRVLLIEDHADAAEILKEALELHGHVVETAASGPEGIERARSFRPDVVLCDIGLPGIDGFEVARRLRADPALGAVPLVALSGYAAPEDLERSREAGFARHLAKPPDLDTLERTLAEVAVARRGGAPAAADPN